MLFSEIIALTIFAVFWWFVYSREAKFFISFFKHKSFNKSLFATFIHVFAVLGIFCFFYAYFIEPYWLKVVHVNLKTDKLKNSFVLVQISDLHCDAKVRNEEKLVKIINEINPDIIVFTGDALNAEKALGNFKKTLKNLNAKSGKFAVRGNFDVWYWKDIDIFEGTGFIELDKEAVSFTSANQDVTIAGLSAESSAENLKFLEKLPGNYYTVFLSHYPGINEIIENTAIDLYLTGHTHGGQFSLPFYGALITMSRYGKKYEAGLYALGKDKALYVNRGIGMEGGVAPRIRFFSRPEITVFYIGPGKKK
ncbi:MAG: metallophosphoesterase [Candidatus Omnitrophica bacterium]|jgi:hypothetical protein|nr:metallophosphoesterase [Candidatus Omnitrophota bacterium]